jgi:hypothetical protein
MKINVYEIINKNKELRKEMNYNNYFHAICRKLMKS